MLIKEYRIVLPMEVSEYQIGQLYAVAKASRVMSGKKERVEILVNEPYEKDGEHGQYTKKIYHIGSRVPGWIRWILPARWLQLHEEAWNAYPKCRTVLTSSAITNFHIIVETIHEPDRGQQENVHQLEGEKLEIREIVPMDIANNELDAKEYSESEDPRLFRSEKTGRGPLVGNWIETTEPIMCAYKLVTVLFKVWGFQGRMENHIHKSQQTMLLKFHRQVFCWMDEWIDMSLEDIRALEGQTKEQLAQIEVPENPDEIEDDSETSASSSSE